MDIRNFFGKKSSNDIVELKKEASATSKKKNKYHSHRITDDNEEDEFEGKNTKQKNKESIEKENQHNISVVASEQQMKESIVQPEIVGCVKEENEVDDNHQASKVDENNGGDESISWQTGESVPYSAIVQAFEDVSKVSGRIDKENIFCKLFKSVIIHNPKELEHVVYLVSNSVFPAYDGMELGIGDSLLVKAICEATGRKKQAVEEDYEREGDLGTVALLSRTSQKTLGFAAKPKPLLASSVLDQFRQITLVKGGKSQDRKVGIIKGLMIKCQGAEAKYLIRALQGKLRIGTASQTVLVALAHAFSECPPLKVKNQMKLDRTSAEHRKGETVDEEEEKGTEPDPMGPSTASSSTSSSSTSTNHASMVTWHGIQEIEPHEASKLRKNYQRINREERNQLAEVIIKRGFSECPNLSSLVSALMDLPLYSLWKVCQLSLGIPVAPMLAKPTKEINEVLKRLSGLAFTMEYKYDGERAQIHYLNDGTVKVFSRNSEDNTEKYPELRDILSHAASGEVKSCIIDAEVVAYDREKQVLMPFQILSTRKRKVETGEEAIQKVKVVLQAFDLLYLNGKSLLRETLRTRRQLLHDNFHDEIGLFQFATGMDHVENGDTAPMEQFLQEACSAMCEGLMIKTLDDNSSYEPSKRSLNWLKLKKDYIDGMGVCDSVDLVVIGGYLGRGKRVNVYGAYLMACYDTEQEEFQSVCKVGTGFKDDDLIRLTELMKSLVIESNRKPHNYNVGDPLVPDQWFHAKVVWELQAADLSKSSVHRGGVGRLEGGSGGQGRGVGLRFPRYLRDRPDKKPDSATSAEQIVEMFFSQNGTEKIDMNDNEDDEFDGI